MVDPLDNEALAQQPIPPEKPLPSDCCDTGCDVCVFDAYTDALADYEKALAEWAQRLKMLNSARGNS